MTVFGVLAGGTLIQIERFSLNLAFSLGERDRTPFAPPLATEGLSALVEN